MIRRLLLPLLLLTLAYSFWASPHFKEIAAGVALFLFGMMALEDGFKAFTGGILENLLRKTTNRIWKSLTFGAVATTIMQSSSLVSVITISFLSAGLLDLVQGIGIIFGANIGTTTGAWLVAAFGLKVKLSAYAMPMLVFGVVLLFQSKKTLKGLGYVLTGIGLLFLGIHYMKEGFDAFREHIDLATYAIPGFTGLLLFTLIGITATVIMQSSHATLVLIITALAAAQISYENALALAIGANIGTTITAIIGSMSANIQGKRLAAAHFVFNAVTGFIAIVFISQLAATVELIAAAVGIARDNYTLKLAVFHTLFNTIGILVMLPLIQPLVNFLIRSLPAKQEPSSKNIDLKHPLSCDLDVKPKYLNESVLLYPDTALEALTNEIQHLYNRSSNLICACLNIDADILHSKRPLKQALNNDFSARDHYNPDALYKQQIRDLYNEIITFSSATPEGMSDAQKLQLFELRAATRDTVESVKDVKHFVKNLYTYMTGENADLRSQYTDFRDRIASTMREIVRLQSLDQAQQIIEIDHLQLGLEKQDIMENGILDRLIRDKRIPTEASASLMNDNSYVHDICHNLLSTSRILFTASSRGISDTERELTLDTSEMREIANQPNQISAK